MDRLRLPRHSKTQHLGELALEEGFGPAQQQGGFWDTCWATETLTLTPGTSALTLVGGVGGVMAGVVGGEVAGVAHGEEAAPGAGGTVVVEGHTQHPVVAPPLIGAQGQGLPLASVEPPDDSQFSQHFYVNLSCILRLKLRNGLQRIHICIFYQNINKNFLIKMLYVL